MWLDSTPSSEGELQEEFLRALQEAYGPIFGCVMSLLPERREAEDVVQDTIVLLWQKYREDGPPEHFRRWACTIAYNVTRNHLRKQSLRKGSVPLSDAHLAQLARVRGAMTEILELRRERLQECLEKLSKSDRRIIAECYAGDGLIRDVARSLGTGVSALYARLKRLRRKLFDCMNLRMAGGQDE
ncbi:sigma-70 family RNA polymerase sigma factor [Calycomorphotria hydatis]|uniref:ECF RNA polymerase sigma factor SigK n=1 Tax=Calycomorphotria hydatis TaxID=2528027 RepID=A0A517T678_9PLAN|nr:sigma-70 family RNA polymerase sigma factor [Calycomorphotria hydatis]QDT63879.1 ECF RNA polymerase sigma factor SigK [Calycomorphotria hydatis]